MTQPLGYLWRMLGFLAVVLVIAALLSPNLARAFAANPLLNGLILAVLLGGVAWNILQVLRLREEVAWVEAFRNARRGAPPREEPRLLAPLAALLAGRRSERIALSAGGLRSVLDGIVARLDETRELSRYMTGLLIFLGLLGTFWGLLLTIGAVAEVIGTMRIGGGDAAVLFDQLKAGLAEPLRGMGIAFSSSMLGLAGALVLGFLDLTAGQAQSRFATELEDWLAGQALLSGGLAAGEGGVAELAPLMDQVGSALAAVQAALEQGGGPAALALLADRMSVLTEQTRATQFLLGRVAEQQAQILQREEERRVEMQEILRVLARRDG
jgi:hypothetical protein